MDATELDLVATVRDLLKRTEEGRRSVKAQSKVIANFWKTAKLRDEAEQKRNGLLSRPLPEEELARCAAEKERAREQAEYERLDKEATGLWVQFTSTLEFIGPFVNAVALLADRLPLTPRWDPYVAELRRLRVNQLDAWTEQPANADLALLEQRLKEIALLATQRPDGSRRKTPDEVLTEFKVNEGIPSHELVAERLGLERSVYFEMKAGRKVSTGTYIKAAQIIGCTADDLKPCWPTD
ncbi:MAG: hypothetical protein ABSB23_21335 [Bryobacteraceae bacterium]|jgi:hypothetical protein